MHSPRSLSHGPSRLLALILTAAAPTSCADDTSCAKPTVCDVLTPRCQRAVMRAVACRRGSLPLSVPISVVDEETLREMYAERSPIEPEAQASYALWSRGLSLFGLAPAEYDLEAARADSAAETAAVYFPESKEIVLVDRGVSTRSEGAVQVLAHEYVHALQDAEYGLEGLNERWAKDFDSALALAALIEGEAVHYQMVTAIELEGRSPQHAQWQSFYEQWQSDELLEAEADEAPVALARMRFPYAFGGSFVTQHWLARGNAGIAALFDDPPRSTREVMFGRDFEREEQLASLRERGVPVLGEEFEAVDSTTLGAWITRIYASRMGVRVRQRLDAARDVAVDLFSVQVDAEKDQVAAAWRVRMTEGNAPYDWAGNVGPISTSWGGDAPEERENFRLESEGPLARDGGLAWRAPSRDRDDGRGEGEAASPAQHWSVLAGAMACRIVHRPAWRDGP